MSDFFFLLDHLVLAEPLSQEVVLRPRPAQLLGEGPVLPLKEGGPDGDLWKMWNRNKKTFVFQDCALGIATNFCARKDTLKLESSKPA